MLFVFIVVSDILSYYVRLRSAFHVVMFVRISALKTMLGASLSPFLVRGFMSYCVYLHIVACNILSYVLYILSSVL